MSDIPAPITPSVDTQRRRLLQATAAGIALGTLAPPAFATTDAVSTVAATRAGRVRGLREQGVHAFKGIRYGADTTGARFQPPRAPRAWSGVADATAYAASAPQRGGAGPGSEDCLFLNVWTPALADGGKRPVLVYIHGGGYDTGSGSDPLYDGTRLCRRGDVVVVTVNHRLNAFGYLHLGRIGGAEVAASGNAGQLDLVLALQWVRDNIAAFGGDPKQVTIAGESAGAISVACLMASPLGGCSTAPSRKAARDTSR